MDRPTMRGWWQDEDGAWHPPGTEPPPPPAPLPETEPELEAEASPEGGFDAEPEPQPEPETQSDPGAELEAEAKPELKPEPEPEYEPEPKAELEPEAEPEPTLAQTRPATAPVRPVLPSRSVVEPDDEPEFEPEPEPTLVDTIVETAPPRVVPPRPALRPPVALPPDERRWHTGHLIAAALAGLLIGAFIGAALKDDSPSATVAAGSTTLLVTTTTSPSDVPGLFGTTAPSGFGSGGGQSQGGPNITAPNPFGASATTSPTTVFGSGLTPTTTSGAVTPLTSFVGDGTFRVGIDIQPGTYRSNGPSTAGVPCSWERQATFGDSTSVIDANPLVLEPVQVTILPSDRGFRTARCQIWTRVG